MFIVGLLNVIGSHVFVFQRGFISLHPLFYCPMFGIESILPNLNLSVVSPEMMFGLGGFLLNLLVLPTLLDSESAVPRTQSVLSAIVLLICFAIPYYSIGFHIPALANGLGFILWGLVAIYRSPSTHSSSRASDSTESHSDTSVQPAD